MIKIENTEVFGWEAAIRGMRNPMNSWDKIDSWHGCRNGDYGHTESVNCGEKCRCDCSFCIGNNDFSLMKKLVSAGSDHSKFMRMINVTMDIKAPMYWWKEFDTYKVGTVRNSCSTMHKIAEKEFTLDDFSHEQLVHWDINGPSTSPLDALIPMGILSQIVDCLNEARRRYLKVKNEEIKKMWWWQMIQLLPSSYNQCSTMQMNYQVLRNIYHARKKHKLYEWRDFCHWVEGLPYSELITMEKEKNNE